MEGEGPAGQHAPGEAQEKLKCNSKTISDVITKIPYTNLSFLNCVFFNARSVMSKNKVDELRILVYKNNIDLAGVCETWLTPDISNAEIEIVGYRLFRRDRSNIRPGRGGGVLLYIKDNIVSNVYEDIFNFHCEALFCEINIDHNNLLVGVCYRSPTCEDIETKNLLNLIRKASAKDLVIMGDFNYPNIDWLNITSDRAGEDFLNLTFDCFLKQHVTFPTRGQNCLDLVITSDDNNVDNLELLEPLMNSDHNGLGFKLLIDCKINDSSIISNLNFNKANFDSINKYLNAIDWNEKLNNLDVGTQWSTFCETLHSSLENNVPKRIGKKQFLPKWFCRAAVIARKKKYQAWVLYRNYKTDYAYTNYKQARNKCILIYRNCKYNYERSIANNIKTDPKSFYAYVRSKNSLNDYVGPVKNKDGEMIKDKNGICCELNNYFASVFTDETSLGDLPVDINCVLTHKITTVELTEDLIFNKLKGLKPNKSAGVDALPSKLLKEVASNIARPLYLIFSNTLQTGELPEDWRKSNITPIFKSGTKSEAKNYRPISLTSHVCKVLESIIKDQVVDYLTKCNLINLSQHGFLRNRSCATNLLTYVNTVGKWLDEGSAVDTVYLDFSKAFDSVPHNRLLIKLKMHGIDGNVLNWISGWLKERKQRVVLGNEKSNWVNVLSGVPQGSVLGPLLFLIYVNDLEDNIKNLMLKFADDAKLFSKIVQYDNFLQEDLNILKEWSVKWGLKFNIDKCKIMHMGKSNPNTVYSIDNTALKVITEERDLGVVMSSDFKSSAQCIQATKTANKIVGIIKRKFTCRKLNLMLNLYKSLVRPHLEYCNSVWNPHYQKDIKLLEDVQRRFLRLIEGFEQLTYEERLQKARLTTLQTRRLRLDLIEVYKIMHGLINLDIEVFFELNRNELRGHKLKIFKPRINTDVGKYLFSYRIIECWNKLPESVVTAASLNIFKGNLDRILKEWGYT